MIAETCEQIERGLLGAGAKVEVVRASDDGGFLVAELGDRRASIDVYDDDGGVVVLVFAGTGTVVSDQDDREEFSPGPGIAGAVLGTLKGQQQGPETP